MALLFTALLGLCAIILGYLLYDFGRQNFVRETEAAIDMEIANILASAPYVNATAIANHIAKKVENASHPLYLYQSSNGTTLAGNMALMPSDVKLVTEGVIGFKHSIDGRQRQVAAKIHTFADGSRLLIARDIHTIIRNHERLKLYSVLIMSFMLVVVLVSFLISTFVVSRINIIANTAKQIMDTGDLSCRISIRSNWDDLSNLAQVLNELLARIEVLMQGIRDVSDNIAHDLRTPLTRLRNTLEHARKQRYGVVDFDALQAEADHLLATFNSLLRIANIEKGRRSQIFEPVNLELLLSDVVDLYDPLAEEKNIRIDADYASVSGFKGDKDLLFQLFANLLDNAIKFSPPDSAVAIHLVDDRNRSRITIADHGIGIADSDKGRVFDRFYRADSSRHVAGNGLGLSLAKAVVELHRGEIKLSDNGPGLRIDVLL